MDPIVHGIKNKFSACIKLERVNFHDRTPWHDLLAPLASPEFALLDSQNTILYRWFGAVAEEEFTAVLNPLCGG